MKNSKLIRNILTGLLTSGIALSLIACGSSNTAPASAQAKEEETQTASEDNEAVSDVHSEQQESEAAPMSEEKDETTGSDSTGKILILYFSADNTKDVDAVSAATPKADGASSVEWIANIIHDTVGGDLVPIIPSVDYPQGYDELADYAKQERDDGGRPAFEDLGVDPTQYDTVFIGYPIWWYEMPMIMDTLFDTYDFSGVTLVPFNTHAGSGDGGTYGDIRELEPNASVLDGLAVAGEDAGKDDAKTRVEKWVAGLNLN